jgi:hypothetical protein
VAGVERDDDVVHAKSPITAPAVRTPRRFRRP